MQVAPAPDIPISDIGLKGGDVVRLITSIRHNPIKNNPFLGIITNNRDPTANLVDHCVHSGADFLVAASFFPKQIIHRFRAIVYKRTPFVVTSECIGPDRRDPTRGSDLRLIDVPDSLWENLLGECNERLISQAIEELLGTIEKYKTERHAMSLDKNTSLLAYGYAIKNNAVDRRRLTALRRASGISIGVPIRPR